MLRVGGPGCRVWKVPAGTVSGKRKRLRGRVWQRSMGRLSPVGGRTLPNRAARDAAGGAAVEDGAAIWNSRTDQPVGSR